MRAMHFPPGALKRDELPDKLLELHPFRADGDHASAGHGGLEHMHGIFPVSAAVDAAGRPSAPQRAFARADRSVFFTPPSF